VPPTWLPVLTYNANISPSPCHFVNNISYAAVISRCGKQHERDTVAKAPVFSKNEAPECIRFCSWTVHHKIFSEELHKVLIWSSAMRLTPYSFSRPSGWPMRLLRRQNLLCRSHSTVAVLWTSRQQAFRQCGLVSSQFLWRNKQIFHPRFSKYALRARLAHVSWTWVWFFWGQNRSRWPDPGPGLRSDPTKIHARKLNLPGAVYQQFARSGIFQAHFSTIPWAHPIAKDSWRHPKVWRFRNVYVWGLLPLALFWLWL
jgi:hypothetical protein